MSAMPASRLEAIVNRSLVATSAAPCAAVELLKSDSHVFT
jgi:hypothetical protein